MNRPLSRTNASRSNLLRLARPLALGALLAAGAAWGASAPQSAIAADPPAAAAPPQPEYPPFTEVSKGHDPVVSTADGVPGLFSLWVRKKDGHVLAELPAGVSSRKFFIALTVAGGELYAGLQQGDMVVYWRQHDKRLALIEPNTETRSTGDQESRDSVKRLFTDRLILDTPILTMGPRGGPVIDATGLFVGQAARFFGPAMQSQQPYLATVKTAKAFPKNVELAFEAPMSGGRLKTLHYSISEIPDANGYRPRVADPRIGYFTTGYTDLGKFQEEGPRVRYINRWRVEKRDPSLKMSPPKNPIVFYIEHTTPVRYRPYVKQGILAWNSAFEKIGIRECIEVRQQDALTGEHMEKDPEDVRYNFVRWLNNNISTAIGPSRAHPMTGEILDADIILTDGWIRYYLSQQIDVLPQIALDGYSPEALAWLEDHPRWDPRVLFASPARKAEILAARAAAKVKDSKPVQETTPSLEEPASDNETLWNPASRFAPATGRTCRAAAGLSTDLAMAQMTFDLMGDAAPAGGDRLDGMPEEFVGPLVAHLTSHEVGHTLGLRHNFRASGAYSMAEINKPDNPQPVMAGSVMDYLPVNINRQGDKLASNFAMLGIGPYDMWAIEYGYTFDENLKPILARVAEPQLQFATDEDTWGPDPLARRYDLGSNPLEFAQSQMQLVQQHRQKIVDNFVKDGQSWAKARRGYETTLGLQMRSLAFMADWLGGAFVRRDYKGDTNGRPPVEVVSPAAQREAIKFVIDNAFQDQAFGLTPALLNHLAVEQWLDSDSFGFAETAWPVHERIMAIQGSAMTALLNPTNLKQLYDNELRTPSDNDAVTLPEVIDTVSNAVWSELDQPAPSGSSARKPWISSLRRNLQREHVERMIDLTLPDSMLATVHKPISNLALRKLEDLKQKIAGVLQQNGSVDPYSRAHLSEALLRITKALDAGYLYNSPKGGGGGTILILR